METPARNFSSTNIAGGQQQADTFFRPDNSTSYPGSTNSVADENQYQGEAGMEVDLMLAYQAGDRTAFEKLYRNYQPKLYRFFVSATGSEAVALDLYQETWTKVIRARENYRAKARFSTWIFAIARNCLNDFYRAANKPINQSISAEEAEAAIDQYSVEGMVGIDDKLSPEEMVSLAQRADYLQEALKLLPDVQKEVVLLRYTAGMSVSEIAIMNNEKPETIKSRLRYALPKLRNSLRLLERGQ